MNTKQILSYWYDIEFFTPFWSATDKNSVKIAHTDYSILLP